MLVTCAILKKNQDNYRQTHAPGPDKIYSLSISRRRDVKFNERVKKNCKERSQRKKLLFERTLSDSVSRSLHFLLIFHPCQLEKVCNYKLVSQTFKIFNQCKSVSISGLSNLAMTFNLGFSMETGRNCFVVSGVIKLLRLFHFRILDAWKSNSNIFNGRRIKNYCKEQESYNPIRNLDYISVSFTFSQCIQYFNTLIFCKFLFF